MPVQLEWLDQILDWAAQQSRTAASDLHGLFDLDHVGCVGHSRGGKLAALQLASEPSTMRCASTPKSTSKASQSTTESPSASLPFFARVACPKPLVPGPAGFCLPWSWPHLSRDASSAWLCLSRPSRWWGMRKSRHPSGW